MDFRCRMCERWMRAKWFSRYRYSRGVCKRCAKHIFRERREYFYAEEKLGPKLDQLDVPFVAVPLPTFGRSRNATDDCVVDVARCLEIERLHDPAACIGTKDWKNDLERFLRVEEHRRRVQREMMENGND